MDSYNTPLVSDPSNVQLLKRIGRVIEIKPDSLSACRAMLEEENPAIRDLLKKHQMRNFSMFLSQLGNRWFVFSYCEYAGRDYKADLDALGKNTAYQEWLDGFQSMEVSDKGDTAWTDMERIFFNP